MRVDQGQRIGWLILDVGVVVNQGVACRFDRPDRALKQLHDDVNHLVDVEVFRQRNEDVLWQLVGEEFDVVELQLRRRFRC